MTSGKNQQAKADAGKTEPTLLQRDFAPALALVNRVLDYGAKKYSRGSWRDVEIVRWDDAQRRHQQALDFKEGEDEESGLPHRAHQIAGLIIMFQHELEAAAKQTGKSIRDTVNLLGDFKPPPQGHKCIAPNFVHSLDAAQCNAAIEAVEAAIPHKKKSGRKRWINARDAVAGDWVRCVTGYRSAATGTQIVVIGKEYRVYQALGCNLLIKDERGLSMWIDKSFFH